MTAQAAADAWPPVIFELPPISDEELAQIPERYREGLLGMAADAGHLVNRERVAAAINDAVRMLQRSGVSRNKESSPTFYFASAPRPAQSAIIWRLENWPMRMTPVRICRQLVRRRASFGGSTAAR
jgi:hypothetical protein